MSDRSSSPASDDQVGAGDRSDPDAASDTDDHREAVRERYAAVVDDAGCCTPGATDTDGSESAAGGTGELDCCGSAATTGSDGMTGSDATTGTEALTDSNTMTSVDAAARGIGYDDSDLDTAPDGSNLGLGCGNPQAIAALEDGEDVLDLGSGGGFDCFLAARAVGPDGNVVGVDMTPEMVDTARENALDSDHDNVEFRLGEIEHLPVADESVDVVISNCVVNLSPDKARVFDEAFRALRPGGRLAVSDLVAVGDMPDALRDDPDAVAACVGGAVAPDTLERLLAEAGFEAVSVELDDGGADDLDSQPSDAVAPATIEARKPTS